MTDILDQLRGIVGAAHVLTASDDQQAYVIDWMKKYRGLKAGGGAAGQYRRGGSRAALLQRGAGHRHSLRGNTGMAGGATPDNSGQQVVLSLTRMNRIREIDPVGNTIMVEAGCVLAAIQQAARDAGRFFPLSLGPKAAAPSAATLPPMPAASPCCATAICAT